MGQHHFVLIHGACHGAWSWFKLIDQLQNVGCKVTALDLLSAGTDFADPNTITSFAEYSKPALDFLESLPDQEKVVLIGHSMGGITTLQLMERFHHKISLAIFISAVITPSGVALTDSPLADMIFKDTPVGAAVEMTFANGADKPPTSINIAKSKLKEIFYTDCASEEIVLASTLLKWFPSQVLASPVTYTREKHGQVPSVYVKNLRDNSILPGTQDYMVENYGPFSEVIEIDDGHFSLWNQPGEITKIVVRLADQYSVNTTQ